MHTSLLSLLTVAGFLSTASGAAPGAILQPDGRVIEKAAEATTKDGRAFEDLRSIQWRPSFFSFVHRDGAASVRSDELPEAMRKGLGSNEEVAKVYDQGSAAATAALARMEAEMAKQEADAVARKERALRRADAIRDLEYMNYESAEYWSQSPFERQLADTITTKMMLEAGISAEDATYSIHQAKLR